MKGKETTEAIWIVRQIQDGMLQRNNDIGLLYLRGLGGKSKENTFWCLSNKGVPQPILILVYENVQSINNQTENRLWCVSRFTSHSGFTPAVRTEPFTVCDSATCVSESVRKEERRELL